MSAKRVYFDTLRSVAFGSISGTYAPIGSALTTRPRIVCFTNTTDVDLIITDDATDSIGRIYVPSKCFKLLDLTSNMIPNKDDGFEVAQGTQFYVMDNGTAPTLGSLILEVVYAEQNY